MGVYYRCSKCETTLHLTPQSEGFGQLRVACFLCGAEAMYSPSGPEPDVKVVNAPSKGGGDFDDPPTNPSQDNPIVKGIELSGVIGVVSDEGPSPTVPLQMPQALLDMDAAEAAPTLPVTGLTDDHLRMFAAKKKAKSDVIDATLPMESPVAMLNAAYTAAKSGKIVRVKPPENSTVEQPGLADEILNRVSDGTPTVAKLNAEGLFGPADPGDQASTAHFSRPQALAPTPNAMPAEAGVNDPTFQARQPPELKQPSALIPAANEDKIPTRSVEGLSNREITSYAQELYTEDTEAPESVDPPDPAPEPTPSTPKALEPLLPGFPAPTPDGPKKRFKHAPQPLTGAIVTPKELRRVEERPTPTPNPPLSKDDGGLSFGEMAGHDAPEDPSGPNMGTPLDNSAGQDEPSLSNSMFTKSPLLDMDPAKLGPMSDGTAQTPQMPRAGRSDALRQEGPVVSTGPESLGGATGLDSGPMVSEDTALATLGVSGDFDGEVPGEQQRSSLKRSGAGLVIVGLVFVIVFFTILGGLYFFFQNGQ